VTDRAAHKSSVPDPGASDRPECRHPNELGSSFFAVDHQPLDGALALDAAMECLFHTGVREFRSLPFLYRLLILGIHFKHSIRMDCRY